MTNPRYVYDLAALDAHARRVRAALPDRVELLYAVKANPDPGLLRTLAGHVDGFEAASGGELRHLGRVLPDLPPAALGGPGKTDAELAAGLAAGVRRFHVESPYELRRLSALAVARGVVADVLLRVNLPAGGASAAGGATDGCPDPPAESWTAGAALVMGGAPSPFGMSAAEAVECAGAPPPGVRVRGAHAHLASGLAAPAAAALARRTVAWAVSVLGPMVAGDTGAVEVNVGGGMAVDYAHPDRLFDWAGYGTALGELLDAYPRVRLRVEPGRSLTAYCGWYLTEVIDVKRSYGEWFAVVAGGTHHLRTPAARGHSQPFRHVPRPGSPDLPRTDGGPVTVVGQLCTPKDVLARAADVGPVAVGDTLAFAMAGAYAWNISHHDFLMHDPPGFVTGDPRSWVRRQPAASPTDADAAATR